MLITLLLLLWIFVSLFLILIILLQRGKGGGLAGALGGAGGSSAFGTKAGDVFTKMTVGVFGFWLLLAMILVWLMKMSPKFVL
jgi:preprotein translocase subunit SecG